MVPLRLMSLKSLSKLKAECQMLETFKFRFLSRILSHSVIHCMNTLTIRYFRYSLHSIFLTVQYNVIGSVLFRNPGFLLCRGCANDGGSPDFGQLTKKETQSTSNCVDKDDIPFLDVVGVFDKRYCCESLQGTSGCS